MLIRLAGTLLLVALATGCGTRQGQLLVRGIGEAPIYIEPSAESSQSPTLPWRGRTLEASANVDLLEEGTPGIVAAEARLRAEGKVHAAIRRQLAELQATPGEKLPAFASAHPSVDRALQAALSAAPVEFEVDWERRSAHARMRLKLATAADVVFASGGGFPAEEDTVSIERRRAERVADAQRQALRLAQNDLVEKILRYRVSRNRTVGESLRVWPELSGAVKGFAAEARTVESQETPDGKWRLAIEADITPLIRNLRDRPKPKNGS